MKRTIVIFSSIILCIILLFNVSKYTFFKGDLNAEMVIAISAIVFFFMGAWLNQRKTSEPSHNEKGFVDYRKIKELQISNREYDVLIALGADLTNKQIADKLYISESTVKKHVSKVFSKLDVSRRAEAIKKAREFHLI